MAVRSCFGVVLGFGAVLFAQATHVIAMHAILLCLCCMATLWRCFLSLLNPSSLRLVHLVPCLKPPTGPLLGTYRYAGLWASLAVVFLVTDSHSPAAMPKTSCSGETRLVLHVPSSS